MAARRFTVCLPGGQVPVNVTCCAGCGAEAAGTVRITDITSAWELAPIRRRRGYLRGPDSRLIRALLSRRVVWDPPACADCRGWHRRRERVRTATYVAIVAVAAILPWLPRVGDRLTCAFVSAVVAIGALYALDIVVEVVWPPILSLSRVDDLVAFTFVDERCARDFAARNGVALSVD